MLAYSRGRRAGQYQACPTRTCDILTVYERGQEMRVIDDSGEWYEVRLNNGETGFIASFLASMDPAS